MIVSRRPPNTLPLIGNGLHFLKDRHQLFSWFEKCERQFGYDTFEILVPTLPPGVIIHDPKNVEFVLKNEGIFSKGTFFKQRSWDLFGEFILIRSVQQFDLDYIEQPLMVNQAMASSMLMASSGGSSEKRD